MGLTRSKPRGALLDLEAIDWPVALRRLGVSMELLGKRQVPCPQCGGSTRYRFTNKFRRGNWICNHCGAGDGIALAAIVTRRTPEEVLRELRRMVGIARPPEQARRQSERRERFVRSLMSRIWEASRELQRGDPVMRYLRSRVAGLDSAIERALSVHVRFHPSLELPEALKRDAKARGLASRWPAMVARVVSVDNRAVGLHRTYLTDAGGKAPFESVKASLGEVATGGAVRLGPPGPVIGVTEGLETGLAILVMARNAFAVWPGLSAVGMENIQLPRECRAVLVFGDNDANGRGFAAQAKLVRRAIAEGRIAKPHYPQQVGWDFVDQLHEAPMVIETLDPPGASAMH